MDDNLENCDVSCEKERQGEDDVNIYEDLDTLESDANANKVVQRFNKRLSSPRKRYLDDEISLQSASEEDVDLYDDLMNVTEDPVKTAEVW